MGGIEEEERERELYILRVRGKKQKT